MATHSSVLAWEIPWTEEPSRLQSMGSQRVGTRLMRLSASTFVYVSDTFYLSHLFGSMSTRFYPVLARKFLPFKVAYSVGLSLIWLQNLLPLLVLLEMLTIAAISPGFLL